MNSYTAFLENTGMTTILPEGATSGASNLVSVNQRGRVLSMVLAGLSIGTAFGLPIGLQIEDVFSWRRTMAFITILGVIVFLGVLYHRALFPQVTTIA